MVQPKINVASTNRDRQTTHRQYRMAITGMARPEGFEPPTPRSVVWCSVQLSYGRINISNSRWKISYDLKSET